MVFPTLLFSSCLLEGEIEEFVVVVARQHAVRKLLEVLCLFFALEYTEYFHFTTPGTTNNS